MLTTKFISRTLVRTIRWLRRKRKSRLPFSSLLLTRDIRLMHRLLI